MLTVASIRSLDPLLICNAYNLVVIDAAGSRITLVDHRDPRQVQIHPTMVPLEFPTVSINSLPDIFFPRQKPFFMFANFREEFDGPIQTQADDITSLGDFDIELTEYYIKPDGGYNNGMITAKNCEFQSIECASHVELISLIGVLPVGIQIKFGCTEIRRNP